MNDEQVLMTLVLDKDLAVTDAPCAAATLIAQYTDGYFAFAINSGNTCVFGFEGEQPVTIDIRELIEMLKPKRAETLH
jgi:hypothetical protein